MLTTGQIYESPSGRHWIITAIKGPFVEIAAKVEVPGGRADNEFCLMDDDFLNGKMKRVQPAECPHCFGDVLCPKHVPPAPAGWTHV